MSQIKDIVKKIKLNHIAIIMDGNRRWAKKNNLPSFEGHKNGVKAFKNITKYAGSLGIKYLTVYAFSTENWNRKESEVNFLMNLLSESIKKEFKELNESNVRLRIMGDLSQLKPKLQEELKKIQEVTSKNTGLNLQIAINYGSRDEIKNAVKNIIKDGKKEDEITEELINDYLYTSNIPDPDLLIRTGGEMRVSNYLLWQIAYSEILVIQKLWPEFNENELNIAIENFASRNRRFGGD